MAEVPRELLRQRDSALIAWARHRHRHRKEGCPSDFASPGCRCLEEAREYGANIASKVEAMVDRLEDRVVSSPLFLATAICSWDPACSGDDQKPCETHMNGARAALMLCEEADHRRRK